MRTNQTRPFPEDHKDSAQTIKIILFHKIYHYPAEGYGIKYEGSFLEKSQSGCVQNFCHFVCLHHFWA